MYEVILTKVQISMNSFFWIWDFIVFSEKCANFSSFMKNDISKTH